MDRSCPVPGLVPGPRACPTLAPAHPATYRGQTPPPRPAGFDRYRPTWPPSPPPRPPQEGTGEVADDTAVEGVVLVVGQGVFVVGHFGRVEPRIPQGGPDGHGWGYPFWNAAARGGPHVPERTSMKARSERTRSNPAGDAALASVRLRQATPRHAGGGPAEPACRATHRLRGEGKRRGGRQTSLPAAVHRGFHRDPTAPFPQFV